MGYLLLPDLKMKCKDDRIISTENHVMSIEDENGKRTAWVSVVRDITARKNTENALRHLSTHDSLTGLYNRAFFQDEFDRLRHSRQLPTSLIIIDVDGMKVANDRLGHSAGDDLLIRTAQVLRTVFRAEDVVARIGGDEFAVLLPLTDQTAVDEALARCRAKLAQHNADHSVELCLSLGAATALASEDFTHAFKTADENMYQDKASHKGGASLR
jgi:diguanylate cyclase (GGDEF)-like protein